MKSTKLERNMHQIGTQYAPFHVLKSTKTQNTQNAMKKRLFITIIAALILSGCKTKYIPLPQVHTEYKTRTDTLIKNDSIYFKDSVFVFQKGDTVFKNKTIFKDRYKTIYKAKTDTIYKTDTITAYMHTETQKENNNKEYLFIIAGAALALLIFKAVKGLI